MAESSQSFYAVSKCLLSKIKEQIDLYLWETRADFQLKEEEIGCSGFEKERGWGAICLASSEFIWLWQWSKSCIPVNPSPISAQVSCKVFSEWVGRRSRQFQTTALEGLRSKYVSVKDSTFTNAFTIWSYPRGDQALVHHWFLFVRRELPMQWAAKSRSIIIGPGLAALKVVSSQTNFVWSKQTIESTEEVQQDDPLGLVWPSTNITKVCCLICAFHATLGEPCYEAIKGSWRKLVEVFVC